jgi:hypothetical protein
MMEGMVSKQFLFLVSTDMLSPLSTHTPTTWLLGLIMNLLVASHGQ